MTAIRYHLRTQTTWIAVMDLVCLITGSVIAVILRFDPGERREYFIDHLEGWFLLFGAILLANYLAGNYRIQYTFSRFNLVVSWLFSLIFALFFLSITSYAWMMDPLGRGVLGLSIVWYSGLSLFLKILVYRNLFRSKAFLCRTVIVGRGSGAEEIRKTVENEWVLPAHKVVAYLQVIDDDSRAIMGDTAMLDGVAVMNTALNTFEDFVRSLGIDLIVTAFEKDEQTSKLYPRLRRLRFEGIEVLTALSAMEIYSGRTPLEFVDEAVLMQAGMESGLPLVRRSKRLFDYVASIAASIVCLPLGLLIAGLIKISSPGSPVFYSQTRIGQFGKTFLMYKFRTMLEGAEDSTGAVWAESNDSRITRLGKVLRRFRLDEMPQFLNVIRGDMSIVGPRPERPEISAELEKKIPYYSERENVMPGLTGWAQIRHPYGSTIEDTANKLEYDFYYIKHLSLSLDLQIVLRTIRIVLFGKERKL